MLSRFWPFLRHNIQRYYIVMLSLIVTAVSRYSIMGKYLNTSAFDVTLPYYLLILSFLFFTAQNLWERLHAQAEPITSFNFTQKRRKYYLLAFLFSLFISWFIFFSFEVNRFSTIIDDRAPRLLIILAGLNLIVLLFSIDFRQKAFWKQLLLFGLVLLVLFPINTVLAVIFALSGSKGGEIGFHSEQLLWIQFLCCLPISILLFFPLFKTKLYTLTGIVLSVLTSITAILISLGLLLIRPSNNIQTYLALLEREDVLINGEIVIQPDLAAETRREISYRTDRIMDTVNDDNPPFLEALETLPDSRGPMIVDEFILLFGFHPNSLVSIDLATYRDFLEQPEDFTYTGEPEPTPEIADVDLTDSEYFLHLRPYSNTFQPNFRQDISFIVNGHENYTIHFKNNLMTIENKIQLLNEEEVILEFDFHQLFTDFPTRSDQKEEESLTDYTYEIGNDEANMTLYFNRIVLNEATQSIEANVFIVIDILNIDQPVSEEIQVSTRPFGFTLNGIDRIIQVRNAHVDPYISEEASRKEAKPIPITINGNDFALKFLHERTGNPIQLLIYDNNEEIVFQESLGVTSFDDNFNQFALEEINESPYLTENDRFKVNLYPLREGVYGTAFTGYIMVTEK